MGLLMNLVVRAHPKSEITLKGKSIYDQQQDNLTGLDRIKLLFSTDDFGGISPEWSFIVQSGSVAMVTGLLIGALKVSKESIDEHKRINQLELYDHKVLGWRKVQDRVTLSLMRSGFKYAAKLGLFTTCFLSTATIFSVYNGKTRVRDFAAAGYLTGMVFKINMGVRGSFAGGLVGCCFGTFAGALYLTSLKLSGHSAEEMRYWHYELSSAYKEIETKNLHRARPGKLDTLTKSHEEFIEPETTKS